jgi:hypothetical protein
MCARTIQQEVVETEIAPVGEFNYKMEVLHSDLQWEDVQSRKRDKKGLCIASPYMYCLGKSVNFIYVALECIELRSFQEMS